MNYITPVTVEDFSIEKGYCTSLISFDHLFALEQVSRKIFAKMVVRLILHFLIC